MIGGAALALRLTRLRVAARRTPGPAAPSDPSSGVYCNGSEAGVVSGGAVSGAVVSTAVVSTAVVVDRGVTTAVVSDARRRRSAAVVLDDGARVDRDRRARRADLDARRPRWSWHRCSGRRHRRAPSRRRSTAAAATTTAATPADHALVRERDRSRRLRCGRRQLRARQRLRAVRADGGRLRRRARRGERPSGGPPAADADAFSSAATSSAELGRSAGSSSTSRLIRSTSGRGGAVRPAPCISSISSLDVDALRRGAGHRRRPPAGIAGEQLEHDPPERVEVGPPIELGQPGRLLRRDVAGRPGHERQRGEVEPAGETEVAEHDRLVGGETRRCCAASTTTGSARWSA